MSKKVITRRDKGNPITWNEMDDNLDYLTDSVDDLYYKISSLTFSGGVVYNNNTPTYITIGGIPTGTTFSNTTITEILDMMFYPSIDPILTPPSLLFKVDVDVIQEIGEIITIEFSSTFDRGKINPANGTSGFRSGLPSKYEYTGDSLVDNTTTSTSDIQIISYKIQEGTNTWSSKIYYDAGEQPKDNKGNDFGNALSAGNITKTLTITGVYPFFASSNDENIVEKQPVNKIGTFYDVELAAGFSQIFDIIATLSIIKVEVWNNLLSKWEEDENFDDNWTLSIVTHDIDGKAINYSRYIFNENITARNIRVYV